MRHRIFLALILLLVVRLPQGIAEQPSSSQAQEIREQEARQILQAAGAQGGVIIHVGCGDGRLTAALQAGDRYLVQGLDIDLKNVEAARKHIQSLGQYGKVSVAQWSGERLPYVDNLANLVVSEDLGRITMHEVMRVLAPHGAAYIKAGGRWQKVVKPWPAEMDQWTHFLHDPDNNAVSHDRLVASPRCLQWISDPVYGRHHDRLASVSAMVSAHGRLFSIEDRGPAVSIKLPAEWRLIARDAFNGVILWELPIHNWQTTSTGFRSGPTQLPRRLVAIGDRVYVALNYGGPLSCLDGATGDTLRTYEATEGVDEILYFDGTLYLAATEAGGAHARRILAIDAATGRRIWERRHEPARNMVPATLAVGPQQLYFHDGQAVVALDRNDGQLAWRTSLPSVDRRPSWLSPTVVIHDGVVLCGDRAVDYPEKWKQNRDLLSGMLAHGGLALLTALSAEDGTKLWQTEAAESFHGAVDVFVIDDLVWASRGPARFFFERSRPILANEVGQDFYIERVTGRHLRTGAVVKTLDAAKAFTLAHHHRCYRNKATDRFIIMGRTGIELINLEGGPSLRHNWTRGMCQYGVMPANGLLYTPPHPCTCYNASKLNGFFAYSSRQEAAWDETAIDRLQTGRASEIPDARPADLRDGGDWPTYRYDNARSGCGDSAVADRVAPAWSRSLGGKLSAPTSADGKVFVSAVDRHTVYALDLVTGEELWSYIAGGRVDSPPTYWRGRVYLGSADGNIQCLDANDGRLVWRYFAAPQRASIVAWNQLESPWPVAGSVLVRDGSVYALAGRSSYLDGGTYFVKLDAVTGEPQRTRQIYSRDPETGRQTVDDVDDLYLAGLLYDIPSSVGSSIFVREARLSLDGDRIEQPLPHLYSVGGFLDDTWWHRYYMLYGTRFKNGPGGGLGRTGGAPYGRLLVCDDQHVYGYGEAKPHRYHLFRTAKDATNPVLPSPPAGGRREGNRARTALPSTSWSVAGFPIMVRALALAGRVDSEQRPSHRLIAAGPPAAALTNVAALHGDEGGLLALVDAASGQTISQLPMESTPVFDGMCVARKHIVLSLTSGAVAAFR